jgi:hypothetical protein
MLGMPTFKPHIFRSHGAWHVAGGATWQSHMDALAHVDKLNRSSWS